MKVYRYNYSKTQSIYIIVQPLAILHKGESSGVYQLGTGGPQKCSKYSDEEKFMLLLQRYKCTGTGL
jgi:hypothetical protein